MREQHRPDEDSNEDALGLTETDQKQGLFCVIRRCLIVCSRLLSMCRCRRLVLRPFSTSEHCLCAEASLTALLVLYSRWSSHERLGQ